MSEETAKSIEQNEILRMAVDIVSAYVGNNTVATDQVPDVISSVYASLSSLDGLQSEANAEPLKPAVSVRRSVNPDYIVCLEDGKKLKMLKRHLRAAYNMTPDDYRAKWGLPADYPMVAPNYASQRSEFAKKIGLGRKKGQKVKRRTA
ncbi:MAG: MucR family transcriptional regulator [Pseudomonadota bacterium]|nr:MucR family transcriptional regulator [Pseudomonadota bacterium]